MTDREDWKNESRDLPENKADCPPAEAAEAPNKEPEEAEEETLTDAYAPLQEEAPAAAPPQLEPVTLPGEAPLTPMAWLGIMVLMCLPGVNLILLTVWACGGCRSRTRINYARGSLLFMLVCLLAVMAVAVTVLAVAGGAFLVHNEELTQMIPFRQLFIS